MKQIPCLAPLEIWLILRTNIHPVINHPLNWHRQLAKDIGKSWRHFAANIFGVWSCVIPIEEGKTLQWSSSSNRVRYLAYHSICPGMVKPNSADKEVHKSVSEYRAGTILFPYMLNGSDSIERSGSSKIQPIAPIQLSGKFSSSQDQKWQNGKWPLFLSQEGPCNTHDAVLLRQETGTDVFVGL